MAYNTCTTESVSAARKQSQSPALIYTTRTAEAMSAARKQSQSAALTYYNTLQSLCLPHGKSHIVLRLYNTTTHCRAGVCRTESVTEAYRLWLHSLYNYTEDVPLWPLMGNLVGGYVGWRVV